MSGFDQEIQIGTTAGAPALPLREESSAKTRVARSGTQSLARLRTWLALAPVLALATFLNFYELSREGDGNTYYAAAVKSMLQNWHNFFFVSFDPGGFVTVDKPPLGFWVQTLSAKIFGFHGWSLILPEALAGVASVALIFHLVRRTYGDVAGLVAALVMAVTPVAISANRSNIVDSLLVFTLLLGAWAIIRATETGKLRWLLLSMLFVGLGFNIKMLQAYLVVPAFFAVYFLGARLRWSTKFWHSLLAGILLLVISLSWAVTVDAIPASERPFVGSSQDNSELNLILGYNGIERLIPRNWSIFGINGLSFGSGQSGATPPAQNQSSTSQTTPTANFGGGGGGPGGVSENGQPGLFRLVNAQLGGEAGWLLPLALIGLIVGAWQVRPRLPLGRQHQALLLWGGWLLTGAIFFSIAGFFHQYYLIMLAPPIAALSGVGIVALWHDYRQRKWLGWLLPLVLVAVGAAQIWLLKPYPGYSHWLAPAIAVLCVAAAIGLIVIRLLPRLQIRRLSMVMASLGMLGLLLAPTAWAADTTLNGTGGLTPRAGPQTNGGQAFGGGGFAPPGGSDGTRIAPQGSGGTADAPFPQGNANARPAGNFAGGTPAGQSVSSAMLNYLLAQQGSTKYLVATTNANTAAPIILQTGKPVMALGGFTGSDPILTPDELSKLVANGTVRFFILDGAGGGGGIRGFSPSGSSATEGRSGSDQETSHNGAFDFGQSGGGLQLQSNDSGSLTNWVTNTCTAVSSSTWESSSSSQSTTQAGIGGGQLYDCANVKAGA